MNQEGWAQHISPELIQATATALVVVLAAGWILRLLGVLWKRTVWQASGPAIERVAATLGGRVEARWTGFRVTTAHGARVDWVGGMLGARTRVRTAQRSESFAGWLDDAAVIERLRAAG